MVSFSQETAISMEKGFCIPKDVFTGRDGRLPSHSDAILSHVYNPKIIILSQHFSMQAIESTGDTTRWFHISV